MAGGARNGAMSYTHLVLARTVDQRLRAFFVIATSDDDARDQVLQELGGSGGPTFASIAAATSIPRPRENLPLEAASVYVGQPTT